MSSHAFVVTRTSIVHTGSRRPTGLEEFGRATLDLISRFVSADGMEIHLFGTDRELIGLSSRGVPHSFVFAYHRAAAWQFDPLAEPRRFGWRRGVIGLGEAGARGDGVRHRAFLDRFGIRHAAEMIFSDGREVTGGVSLIWTQGDETDFRRDEKAAANLHGYINFNFNEAWRRTGIGRRRRLVRDYGLTLREAEVADLVCTGRRNEEVSRRLGIGLSTTKSHLIKIFAKLDVRSRAAAVHKMMAEAGGSTASDPL